MGESEGGGAGDVSEFEYPERCPVAADLREALANWDDLEPDQIKELVVYAAETLERQHQYLRFIHGSMKGSGAVGNA